MNMEALFELKKQYELELIRAEAKVAVINDIISTTVPTNECESTDYAETASETPTINY